MWAYRARDGLATAMHGTWGAFWLGYGFLNLLVTTGALTLPTAAFVCVARRCSPLASGSGRALPLRD